jgi:hypothetical protein
MNAPFRTFLSSFQRRPELDPSKIWRYFRIRPKISPLIDTFSVFVSFGGASSTCFGGVGVTRLVLLDPGSRSGVVLPVAVDLDVLGCEESGVRPPSAPISPRESRPPLSPSSFDTVSASRRRGRVVVEVDA